jgi:chaperonin GroES
VKSKVLGKDDAIYKLDDKGEFILDPETGEKDEVLPAGVKQEKGDRIAEYENYIINNHLKDWQEDEDKLLFACAILGDMFKKTYYDPYKKMIVSELIYPLDLVVNINATNMEDFPVSQTYSMSQNEVKQRMVAEDFIEYDIDELLGSSEKEEQKEGDHQDEYDEPVELIEQHRLIDLDGDGYKEPYIVTIASDKVLKIAKRFSADDITYVNDNKVLEIKSINFFTHRIFIPNPKGTFYGIGYGFILKKINKIVNTTSNQLLEAGINSNLTRGFISSDLKVKGQDLVLKQNEWKVVAPPPMGSIDGGIVPMISKEPSIVLYNLMTFLIETSKQLSGITDVLGGNIPANMQPTTALASIEQGLKEFKAIYKRMYRSLTKEIKKIHKIIANNEARFSEEYKTVLDDNKADFQKDFNDDTLDIQLSADTEVVTNIEQVAKANFLMTFIGNQQINQVKLLRRILGSAKIEDFNELVIEPQPNAPDPTMEMLKIQQQIENGKLKVAIQDSNRQMAEAAAKSRTMDAKILEMEVKTAKTEAEAEKLRAETMKVLSEIRNERDRLKLEADKLYEPINKPTETKTDEVQQGRPTKMEG